MNDITPKEAIANLNHIYGMVAPDIQRSIDVAIKALERPTGDAISRSALKEDFKSRLADCNEWIEKAKDKETKIRASAVKTFLGEVIMTIDNAPPVDAIVNTVEVRTKGEWIEKEATPASVYYCCSNCGMEGVPVTPYCPWCGAQMKGGAK